MSNLFFDDKKYWENYYSNTLNGIHTNEPSPFAKDLAKKKIINSKRLIELGCGNGRDSIFFNKMGAAVTAVDQCLVTTKEIDKIDGIKSYAADFTNLPNKEEKFDLVYSRFTLHSIDAEGEDRTLSWAYSNLKDKGKLCVEVRTLKDPIFGKGEDKGGNTWFYNNHHRRFVDAKEFKIKLIQLGFEIELFKEDNGLAVHPSGDPIVLRVIASKS